MLGQLTELRAEVGSLRAGKVRSDDRIAALEKTQAELCGEETKDTEKAGMDNTETEKAEDPASRDDEPNRRRAQGSQAYTRVHDFQALTAAAMDACCPSGGGGHRR